MKSFFLVKEKYLIRVIQILVGIMFLVPFITWSTFYFPFIVPRNLTFRIVVEVLVIVYGILVLQNKNYLPKWSFVTKLVYIFIGFLTVSSIVNGTFLISFWSDYERMDGLVTLYHLLALFIVLIGTFRDRKYFEELMLVSLFISFVQVMVGMGQFVGANILIASSTGDRISATMGNPTYLAAYLLIHIFIALYFLSLRRSDAMVLKIFGYGSIVLDAVLVYMQVVYGMGPDRIGIIQQIFTTPALAIPMIAVQALSIASLFIRRIDWYRRYSAMVVNGILIALFLIIIGSTQTRGALVGLGAGIVTMAGLALILPTDIVKKRIKVITIVSVVFMVFLVGLLFLNKQSEIVAKVPIFNKITSISLTDSTTLTRIATWKSGLKGFYDKPILGWGVENFNEVFNKYFPTVIYTDEGTPLWFDRPHNILVQYLVEGGIIGLALYLMLIGSLIYFLNKRKVGLGLTGVILSGLFVAYVGQNIFVFDSINSYIPFYFLLGFSVFLITAKNETDTGSLTPRPVASTYAWPLIAVIIIGMGFALRENIAQMKTNTAFVKEYRGMMASHKGTAWDETPFTNALSIVDTSPYLGRPELLGLESEYLVGLIQDKAFPNTDLQSIVDGVATRMEKMAEDSPNDARLQLFLMNLYLNGSSISRGYLDKLLVVAETAKKLSPTRPQIYYISGRAHMIRGEYQLGIADFKTAAELAPRVFDAQWNLMAAYMTMGDTKMTEQTIATLKSIRPFDEFIYSRIAGIYIALSQLDRAIATVQEALVQYPSSVDLRLTIAQIYAKQGNKEKAKKYIQEAVAIDPTIKDEADAFLKSLDSKVSQQLKG